MTNAWQHLDPRVARQRGPEWVLALRCAQDARDFRNLVGYGADALMTAQLDRSSRLMYVEATAFASFAALFLTFGGGSVTSDGSHPEALASSHAPTWQVTGDYVRTPRPEALIVSAAPVPVTTTSATSTTVPPPTTTTARPPVKPVPRPVTPSAAVVHQPTPGNMQMGGASFYDYKAGGCAHKTLPKGTVVTVTNLANGKSTTCVVDDRGPYVAGRIIDLDRTVFSRIASVSSGVINARITW